MKKANIAEAVQITNKVLESPTILGLFNEEYFHLFNLDIDGLIEHFNNGDTSTLYSEDSQTLVDTKVTSAKIFRSIILLKKFWEIKYLILSRIEEKKEKFIFNEDKLIAPEYEFIPKITYKQFYKVYAIAEKVLNDKRTYQLLNFLLKNENLIPDIITRRQLYDNYNNHPDKTTELSDLLHQDNGPVGIVSINDNGKISIDVGTQKEMDISNLIGKPFKKDEDEPGYYYGPHDDFYRGPRKVTKTLHQAETEHHMSMIAEEENNRANMKYISYDALYDMGFIMDGEYAVMITRKELYSCGIDPERVGWEPLELEKRPKTILGLREELSEESSKDITIPNILRIKKDQLVLSLKKGIK